MSFKQLHVFEVFIKISVSVAWAGFCTGFS